jgi:hypothetical protein
MVVNPVGHRIKNRCAGEDRRNLTVRQSVGQMIFYINIASQSPIIGSRLPLQYLGFGGKLSFEL